jgi:uncharacterized protein YjiS (DUF1127 family)
MNYITKRSIENSQIGLFMNLAQIPLSLQERVRVRWQLKEISE